MVPRTKPQKIKIVICAKRKLQIVHQRDGVCRQPQTPWFLFQAAAPAIRELAWRLSLSAQLSGFCSGQDTASDPAHHGPFNTPPPPSIPPPPPPGGGPARRLLRAVFLPPSTWTQTHVPLTALASVSVYCVQRTDIYFC